MEVTSGLGQRDDRTAKNRGEVPADLDAATALELVIAPLHFRSLLTRQPLDDRGIAPLVDLLLAGLAR